MHVTTVLPPKYEAMLGEQGGKDWGIQEAGMKQLDDNVGLVLAKLEQMGQLDNTVVVFTTDNGAEAISFPDVGVTPFKGQTGEAWEGSYRGPCIIRWLGGHQAGDGVHRDVLRPHHAGPEHSPRSVRAGSRPLPEDRPQCRRRTRLSSTAYLYDWNMLLIGQQLWFEWFETLKEFPPLQAPASYNLTQVMEQLKGSGHGSD